MNWTAYISILKMCWFCHENVLEVYLFFGSTTALPCPALPHLSTAPVRPVLFTSRAVTSGCKRVHTQRSTEWRRQCFTSNEVGGLPPPPGRLRIVVAFRPSFLPSSFVWPRVKWMQCMHSWVRINYRMYSYLLTRGNIVFNLLLVQERFAQGPIIGPDAVAVCLG